jgi:hypothetical protein
VILRCFYPSDVKRRFGQYFSRPPGDRAELDSASEIILGHFTSSTFLQSITTNGLLPDKAKQRVMDDNLPSDGSSVYLSTTFQRFYMERVVRFHGGKALIIEVRVRRSALTADEEWLEPAERPECDADEALYRTMCGGSCKHIGSVLPDQILSIWAADGTVLIGNDTE